MHEREYPLGAPNNAPNPKMDVRNPIESESRREKALAIMRLRERTLKQSNKFLDSIEFGSKTHDALQGDFSNYMWPLLEEWRQIAVDLAGLTQDEYLAQVMYEQVEKED